MNTEPLRVVVVGGRTFTRRVLEHLFDKSGPWSVVGVVEPTGSVARTQAGNDTMREVCEQASVAHLETVDIGSADAVTWLTERAPDVCLCCGWRTIVPEHVLAIPERVFLGVHAGALPADRGGAPVNWQILRGDDEVGLSVFEFVPELDHGDVYAQTAVPVESRDDVGTVYDRVTNETQRQVVAVLRELASEDATPTTQSFTDATYLPMRTPADGIVDWSWSATFVVDWVRAQSRPYPGAYTWFDGEQLTLWGATHQPATTSGSSTPGEVVTVVPGSGMDVSAGTGTVRLQRVQIGTRAAEWADEFATRVGIESGDRLGTPADVSDWFYTGIRGPDGEFDFETNVEVGETATVTAVCCSYGRTRRVTVETALDGTTVDVSDLDVEGWMASRVAVAVDQPGAHSLTVQFESDGSTVDNRFLRVYAHE